MNERHLKYIFSKVSKEFLANRQCLYYPGRTSYLIVSFGKEMISEAKNTKIKPRMKVNSLILHIVKKIQGTYTNTSN